MEKELEVRILGRGTENLTEEQLKDVDNIGDLRNLLGMDADVQALNDKGKRLSDTDSVSNLQQVRFSPNVAGGS